MKHKRCRAALLWLLGALFLVSAFQVGRILYRGHQEEAAFQALAAQVPAQEDTHTSPETPTAEKDSYASLKAQNPDYFGWLSIPNTKLDYPVMYTPAEPEHYLRRSFDGEYSVSGVPFVGAGWKESGAHTMIYGHNMKNGTMFATLLSYADKDFWVEHPAISLTTSEGAYTYQVLGAFYSKAYPSAEEDVFRYYQCSDLSAPEAFGAYIEHVRAAALYDTGVEAVPGGRLLTLSTCSYHTRNGRFVVVGYCAQP